MIIRDHKDGLKKFQMLELRSSHQWVIVAVWKLQKTQAASAVEVVSGGVTWFAMRVRRERKGSIGTGVPTLFRQ